MFTFQVIHTPGAGFQVHVYQAGGLVFPLSAHITFATRRQARTWAVSICGENGKE